MKNKNRSFKLRGNYLNKDEDVTFKVDENVYMVIDSKEMELRRNMSKEDQLLFFGCYIEYLTPINQFSDHF